MKTETLNLKPETLNVYISRKERRGRRVLLLTLALKRSQFHATGERRGLINGKRKDENGKPET